MRSSVLYRAHAAAMACLTAALLAALGCGADDDLPATAPVSGVVTLAGSPVAGASVTFHPTDSGIAAAARTDESGAFEVATFFDLGKRSKPGMAPGDYRVTITKLDTDSIMTTMQPPKNLLPDKYASQRSSGLTAAIAQPGPNELEFPLER